MQTKAIEKLSEALFMTRWGKTKDDKELVNSEVEDFLRTCGELMTEMVQVK